MTLTELGHLLRRYGKWMLAAIAVITALAGAYGYLAPKTYQAKASAVLSGYTDFIQATAEQEAKSEVYTTSISVSTSGSTITVTSAGPDEQICIAEANAVIDILGATAVELIPTTEIQQAPTVLESYASEASVTSRGLKFYLMLGFAGAVFVAFCGVLIYYYACGFVSCVAAENKTGLPLLEVLPVADSGARLVANVEFAAGKKPDSLCVVPVGAADAASVAELLDGAAATGVANSDAAGAVLQASAVSSISSDVSAAYTARDAEATVLVVKEFVSTTSELDLALRELKLAKANLIGFVYEEA